MYGLLRPREDTGVSVSLLVLVVAFYAAVATGYLEARRRREAPPTWARWAGPISVAAHLAGLMVLSASMSRSPFATGSQAISFLAFSLVALYLLLEIRSQVATHGGGFYAVAAALTAMSVPGLVEAGPATLANIPRDAARSLHVGLSLMGSSAVLAGGLLAMGYLGTYRRVKSRQLTGGTTGPSLGGFERLARLASLLGIVLLVPSLSLGIRVERVAGAVDMTPLTVTMGVVMTLVCAAFAIWWRRPRRGALAAWLNVIAVLVLIVGFGVVHPLVLRGGA